tara:strand:- start:5281 stop:5646 length:366 start_codon:yes stop_codon:yes gene_type:complete
MPTGDPMCPKCGQYLANSCDDLGVHKCPTNEFVEYPILEGSPGEFMAQTVCVSGMAGYVEQEEYATEGISYDEFAAETEEKMRDLLSDALQEWIETHDDATMVVPAVVEEIMTRMRDEGLV